MPSHVLPPLSPSSRPAAAGFHPPPSASDDFRHAMRLALSRRPHTIAPVFFYDERGSRLFEAICQQPEYYVTRVEMGMLQEHAAAIAERIGPDAELVEFGADSSRKFRTLLAALHAPRRYVPIDVSGAHLQQEAAALRRDHPLLEVTPVVADFMQPFRLPPSRPAARQRVGLYLGSSLGNFDADEARAFLAMAGRALAGGGLLVGIDLVKDPAVLHAAYNDAAGVTAAFNRNLLVRANHELHTDFHPERFYHHACYAPALQRVEMHLVSMTRQTVRLDGESFTLAEGESLHTECAHKFTLNGFRALSESVGLQPGPVWLDAQRWFALQWLDCPPLTGSDPFPGAHRPSPT